MPDEFCRRDAPDDVLDRWNPPLFVPVIDKPGVLFGGGELPLLIVTVTVPTTPFTVLGV